MILKTLTHDHGSSDVWNYYDNIDSASVYFDEGCGENVISVCFKGVPASIVMTINDAAYLCNDEGKTIERLRPAVKEDDTEDELIEYRAKCKVEWE